MRLLGSCCARRRTWAGRAEAEGGFLGGKPRENRGWKPEAVAGPCCGRFVPSVSSSRLARCVEFETNREPCSWAVVPFYPFFGGGFPYSNRLLTSLLEDLGYLASIGYVFILVGVTGVSALVPRVREPRMNINPWLSHLLKTRIDEGFRTGQSPCHK